MRTSTSLTFQFEDVAAALLGLDIRSSRVPTVGARRKAWLASQEARLLRRHGTRSGRRFVLAVGQNVVALHDHISSLSTIDGAQLRVAYVEEFWKEQLPLRADLRAFLNRFDHVFLGAAGTCTALEGSIRPPVTYLPHAVDVERFTAGRTPDRVIDVYAMGRRNERHHELLLERADQRGSLYLYDTMLRNPPVASHDVHRRNLVGLIRRTNVFMVNEAKVNRQEQRGAQSEVGYRYFEGAAGGAVLVGQRPGTPVYGELFPTEEPVVEVRSDGADLLATLDELSEDPARVARIRRANVAGALVRHDVAHRVDSMLRTLGLEVPDGVTTRIERLRARAAEWGVVC